jgi:hypothetical protein
MLGLKERFCHNMVHMIRKFVGRDNCQYLYLNCDIIVCKDILQL